MNSVAERSYRWLFWTMALVGLAVDQGSKYLMFKVLYNEGQGGDIVLVQGVFGFHVRYQLPGDSDVGEGLLRSLRTVSGDLMPFVNEGALWGQKLGFEGITANQIFAAISLIAAIAIAGWSALPKSPRDGWLCFALGLIFAGAVGNFYDRVVFRGVRDFLHFHPFDFPVFNVADSCLVCGAAVLMVHALFVQPTDEKKPALEPIAPAPEAEAEAAGVAK